MRFLLYSDAGDLLWMAMRLQREGHDVTLFTFDAHAHGLGQGLVDRTEHPRTTPDTVIVFDGTGHGELGTLYRKTGYAVLGGNPLDVALEVDRAQAMKLAQSFGIGIPRTKVFATVDEVIGFLQNTDDEWYFKVSGSNLSCADTYSDRDPKALARFLGWAKKRLTGGSESFLLQQKVDGIECDIEGLFDGLKFIPGGFTATLEDKRYGLEGHGPRTGCQSNVVWQLPDDHPLVQETVLKWADLLRQSGYVGPFSQNSIWTDNGAIFLELTARFGFDATQASHGLLLEGNLGETLAAWARGELQRYPYRPDLFAATLRVSTLPFPVESVSAAEEMTDLPIGRLWLDDPSVFCDDVKLGDDGLPVLAGRDGNVGCVGALGNDWPLMQRQLVEKAAQMGVPHGQWFPPVERALTAWVGLANLGYLQLAA